MTTRGRGSEACPKMDAPTRRVLLARARTDCYFTRMVSRIRAVLCSTFSVTLLACSSSALLACTSSAESPPASVADSGTPDAPVASCPESTGAPIEHGGDVAADETWAAGTHHVKSSVTLRAGVTLTIAPCAVVKLDANANITIDDEAKGLVALGTATQPIVFERNDPAKAWGAILAWAPATARLAYATLRGGGTTNTANVLDSAELAGATLAGRNQTGAAKDLLSVDHVTIEGSTGLGVLLDSAGFVAGSTDLVVNGSGSYPVYLGAAYAGNLPKGVYTGNAKSAFLLQSVGPAVYDNLEPLLWDATIPERGLPYQVGHKGGSVISVGDGRTESPKATLTIEPGVELRFLAGGSEKGQLLVRAQSIGGKWQAQGTLIANGTADKPILLTSAAETKAPGDWQGLYFEHVADPRDSVQFARISYAGGESTSTGLCKASMGATNFDADCSVILWLDDAPSKAFIGNTRIENGRGCGIYRAWKGSSVDFSATNTFTSVAGCDQSNVAPLAGDCDSTGPCK